MRKVNQLVVSFLRQGIEGKASSNTKVSRATVGAGLEVTLHGNAIACYSPATGKLALHDAGWRTVTTKDRLNALLEAFAPGWRIVQRDYQWYLATPAGELEDWTGHLYLDATN